MIEAPVSEDDMDESSDYLDEFHGVEESGEDQDEQEENEKETSRPPNRSQQQIDTQEHISYTMGDSQRTQTVF